MIDFIGVKLISNKTAHFNQKIIHWDSITSAASGIYVCQSTLITLNNGSMSSHENRSLELDVLQPKLPKIIDSNFENGSVLIYSMEDPIQLQCTSFGIPHPNITWYKDDNVLTPNENDPRLTFQENNTKLNIEYLISDDAGQYKCTATSRIGSTSQEATLQITSKYLYCIQQFNTLNNYTI